MIKLIYSVKRERAEAEKQWLRQLKVYPSTRQTYDFSNSVVQEIVQFGMIVTDEILMLLRLRHDKINIITDK